MFFSRVIAVAGLGILVGCLFPSEEGGGSGLFARDDGAVFVGTYHGLCLPDDGTYPRTELLVESFDDDRVAWRIRSADGQPVPSLHVLELGVLPDGFVELDRDAEFLAAISDPGFRGVLRIVETVDTDGQVINRGVVDVTGGDSERIMVNTTSITMDRAFCDGVVPR